MLPVLVLAEDLPAAVLADLLGMHVNTAERWAKIASRDWADNITARAHSQADQYYGSTRRLTCLAGGCVWFCAPT